MFKGSIVALVTPMAMDGSIDTGSLRSLVDWHIESGTDALVLMGTTGETVTINDSGFRLVIETVIEQAAGRIQIIAGTGSASTTRAIQLTRLAEQLQVDACLTVVPYYNKPTQEGMFEHFKAIAESSSLPQILYNVPSRTVVDLLPETVVRLAELENIVAIKEATGSLERLQELMVLDKQSFTLLSGDDPTALEFISKGGHGVISVTANVAPELMADMCRFAIKGDYKKAATINDTLMELHELLFIEPNPTVVKYLLNKLGRIPAGIRLPLLPLSVEHHGKLDKIAQKVLEKSFSASNN